MRVATGTVRCLQVVSAKVPFVFLSTTFANVCGTTKQDGVPFCVNNTKLLLGVVLSPLFVFNFNLRAGNTTCTA